MPIFNYLTSEGKSLKVNTDSLNNDSKEKIKTYIKEDLVKKESLSAQETEMQMDPVGITDADSEGREKFDDIATTLGFRQFYYGGKGGYHEASGSFLYHGLANIAGVGMTDLDKKKARQEIYTEDDGDRDNLFEKGQKITYDFLKDAQDYQLKAAKKVKEKTPDDFFTKVYSAFGGAAVQIPMYVGATVAAGGNPIIGMAAVDAVVAADKGIKESIIAGAKGAGMGYALKYINQFAPATRISAMGTLGFGMPSQSLEERMVNGITFASLAGIGPVGGAKGYVEKGVDKVLDYRSKQQFIKDLEKTTPSTGKELQTSIDGWNFLQARKESIRSEVTQLKKKKDRQKLDEKKEATQKKIDELVLEFRQAGASQGQLKKVIDTLDDYLQQQTSFVNEVNKQVSDLREPTEFKLDAVKLEVTKETVTKKNKETGKKETVEVEVKRLKKNYTDLDTKLLKKLGRATLPQEFNQNPVVRKMVDEFNIFRIKNEDLVLKILDNPTFTKTMGVTALRYGKLEPSAGGMLFRFNRLSQKEKQTLVDGTFNVEVAYNNFLASRREFVANKLKEDSTLNKEKIKSEYKNYRFDKEGVVTDKYLQELGFNKEQASSYRDVINGFEKVRQYYNSQIKKTGNRTTALLPRRPNYFPHIFTGNYRVYVNNKNGVLEQALPAATKIGALKLQKKLQDELGSEYKVNINRPDRSSYSDDAVTAFQTVQEHLFRGKKTTLGLKIKEISDAVYATNGFNRRKLKRRTPKEESVQGFLGSGGRSIFGTKSAKKNVDDFNLAIKLYVEGGVKAANHIEFNYRIKQLIDSPIRFDVKYGEKNTLRQLYPNAVEFGVNYINNALGNPVAIKTGGKKSSKPKEVIETVEETILGRNFKNVYTNTAALANHFYLLSLNARFALAQGIQPYQMIPHKLAHFSQLAGMNSGKALADAYITVLKVQKELVMPSDFSKAVIREAVKQRTINDNFLREFAGEGYYQKSGFSDVKTMPKQVKNILSGRALASNMEQFSRLNATLLFAHHLKRLGASDKTATARSWQLADKYMVRYDMAERPMVFQQAGTIGRAAGLFRTFQHNWYAQMIEAVKNADKGNRAQLIGFVGSNILTAGVLGTIGISSADSLINLSNKLFKTSMPTLSLALINSGLSDWLLFGVPSTVLNADLTATLAAPSFSPADIVSFPGIDFGVNISLGAAKLTTQYLLNPISEEIRGKPLRIPMDKEQVKKAWKQVTPKGVFHAAIEQFTYQDDNPFKISNDNATIQRNFSDWKARWLTSYSLRESKLIKWTWHNSQLERATTMEADAILDYLAHNSFKFDSPLIIPQWALDELIELGYNSEKILKGLQSRVKNLGQGAVQKLLRGNMTERKAEKIQQILNMLGEGDK